jgi:hypothetical protein
MSSNNGCDRAIGLHSRSSPTIAPNFASLNKLVLRQAPGTNEPLHSGDAALAERRGMNTDNRA